MLQRVPSNKKYETIVLATARGNKKAMQDAYDALSKDDKNAVGRYDFFAMLGSRGIKYSD